MADDTLRDALAATFDALLTDVVAEMKVVGDSYGEDGMVSNRSVAQAFRYYASSWLADRIRKARDAALAAAETPGLDVERLTDGDVARALHDTRMIVGYWPDPSKIGGQWEVWGAALRAALPSTDPEEADRGNR